MNLNITSLKDKFDGNWITKQSIYFLHNKIQYSHEEKLHLKLYQLGINKYIGQLAFNNTTNKILYDIVTYDKNIYKKDKNYSNYDYLFKTILAYQLIIQLQLSHNKFSYSENISSINNNLKVAIGKLKIYNQYWAVVITSYIKQQ
uniref:Uncharacterized protein n=1 Tax=Nitophyllum punctatum TaxID=158729 RepID=A0A4D6WV04_9FLOR|nr:hypothetical protein [Nitophyllum punctatum]